MNSRSSKHKSGTNFEKTPVLETDNIRSFLTQQGNENVGFSGAHGIRWRI